MKTDEGFSEAPNDPGTAIRRRTLSPAVAIFFHNPAITTLFSALLENRGISTRILDSLHNLGNAKLITEPRFYNDLSAEARARCLIVGGLTPLRGHAGCTLLQPLTEEKVESALAKFLAAG